VDLVLQRKEAILQESCLLSQVSLVLSVYGNVTQELNLLNKEKRLKIIVVLV